MKNKKEIDWGQASVDALRRATILDPMEKREFASLRLGTRINKVSEEEIQAWVDNMSVDEIKTGFFKGSFFVDDGAHGYLIVRPDHPHSALAQKLMAETGYNYQLKGGTILLEEDCEAEKFINLTKGLK